jgi:hypothetical protein
MSMPADNLKWVTQESYKNLEDEAVRMRDLYYNECAKNEILVARLLALTWSEDIEIEILTDEDKAALDALGDDLVDRLLKEHANPQ